MLEKIRHSGELTFAVLGAAGRSSGLDRVNRMAAAVAYRLMFALTPLLLIALFTLGLVMGNSTEAQQEMLDFIKSVAGVTVSVAMEELVGSLVEGSNTAGAIGLVLLLWTGSSLFLELQNDLNDIFGVPYEHTAGLVQTVLKRLVGFGWTLSIGLIVLVIWLLNSTWQYLGDLLPEGFGAAHTVIAILAPVVSLLLLPFVFGLVFQTLTRVKVRWKAVWWGSFFTSMTFLLTAYGVGVYFRLSRQNAVGLAGALFVILLVAYLLSAVFMVGAEVTKVYDRYLSSGVVSVGEVSEGPRAIVAAPDPAMPTSALVGFVTGLFVGWRRKG